MRPIISLRKRLACRHGMVLAQFTLLAVVLLAFLGVAAYFGLTGLLQNELQKATNIAALSGAAACYDGIDPNGYPAYSANNAIQSATTAFNRIKAGSALLSSMNAQLTGPVTVNSTVRVNATASLATSFLVPIGLQGMQIQAGSEASPAKEVQLLPTGLAAGKFTMIALTQPLLDGPGPDLHIIPASPNEGYLLEACAGTNDCYLLDNAAQPAGTGILVDTVINGKSTRVLYGEQVIDLGATQANYQAYVKKANYLKVTDAGLSDQYQGVQRSLFLQPPPLNMIQFIEIYHHGVLCQSVCNMPTNFFTMP